MIPQNHDEPELRRQIGRNLREPDRRYRDLGLLPPPRNISLNIRGNSYRFEDKLKACIVRPAKATE